jgi:hypothetical protein
LKRSESAVLKRFSADVRCFAHFGSNLPQIARVEHDGRPRAFKYGKDEVKLIGEAGAAVELARR